MARAAVVLAEKERWRRVDALFDAALERPHGERTTFLARECPNRPTRELVERLLARADEADDFLRPGGAADGPFVVEMATALGLASELPAGSRIGPYEVMGLLGEGGMGKVYRARDTQLGRQVAVKTLPAAGAGQAERLQRFAREARLLARLNHPHIGAIYGLEQLDGQPFLILELVAGPTLEEHLAAGALPLERAVEIALQVAAALEEAHAKGIVHRDLKPGNIQLAEDGAVKVLDFGLAKLLPEAPPETPGASGDSAAGPLSADGMILGTAAYMSPEQARGRPVDKRADIWAFGCLLYEMLAGASAFGRDSGAETLTAILREEPDLGRLPAGTPAVLVRLLRRCLAKDERRRLRDIGDARIELAEWCDGADAEAGPPPPPAPRSRAAAPGPWLVSASALVAALGLGAALLAPWDAPAPGKAPAAPVRLQLAPGPAAELPEDYSTLAVPSPDGAHVVFTARSEGESLLWVRPLDDLSARPLAGTEEAKMPFFSPDGRWVGFFAGRKLKKVPLEGGPVIELAEIGGNPRGAAWGPDDTIVLAPSRTSGLVTMSAGGGSPEPLTELDPALAERSHRWPQVLPDGRGVLFTVQSEGASFDEARIAVAAADGNSPKTVIERGAHGRYLPSGHLSFVRAGRLFAVPFDLERLESAGEPSLVLEEVAYDPRNGGAQFAVSETGTLVYRPGAPIAADNRPVWVDRRGERSRIEEVARVYGEPRLSPDGQSLLLRIGTSGESGLWRIDLPNRSLTRLTFMPSLAPVWAPDGRSVVFAAPNPDQLDLFRLDLDAGTEPVALSPSPYRQLPAAFAPDGRTLIYQELRPGSGWDLLALDLDAGGAVRGEARPLLATPANETRAAFSPDGRFLAYASDELDSVDEIYVRSYPDLAEKWRVSTGGARRPVWRPDGREIYYWKTGEQELVAVAYRARGARFEIEHEQVLLAAGESLWRAGPEGGVAADPSSGFDAAAGGERFVLLEPESAGAVPQSACFVVVLNWFEELPR